MIGGYWLWISGILFIAGLIFNEPAVILVSLLFFLAGGLSRLWQRYCFSRVEFNHSLSRNYAFPGDEVKLEIEVANEKPIPLPWLQIDDEIPKELPLINGLARQSNKPDHMVIRNLFSLGWYTRIKRHYTIKCLTRGYFVLGPATLSSGDPFGFFSRNKEVEHPVYLTVYPRLVPLESLGIPSNQLLGDIKAKGNLCPDPITTRGIRDYSCEDSMKQIHWRASARTGRLQTRVSEQTTTPDFNIFLDVRTLPLPFWGYVPQLHELSIIVAASIAKFSLDQKHPVGLYVNQRSNYSWGLVRIPSGRDKDQLQVILKTLAQVHPLEAMSISRLLLNESKNMRWGATMVAISAAPGPDLLAALGAIQRTGRRAALITLGQTPDIRNNEIRTYYVPDDVSWNEIETLRIEE